MRQVNVGRASNDNNRQNSEKVPRKSPARGGAGDKSKVRHAAQSIPENLNFLPGNFPGRKVSPSVPPPPRVVAPPKVRPPARTRRPAAAGPTGPSPLASGEASRRSRRCQWRPPTSQPPRTRSDFKYLKKTYQLCPSHGSLCSPDREKKLESQLGSNKGVSVNLLVIP